MSGDVGAEVAAVLRDRGWLDSADAEDAARDLAPLIAERVEAAKAEALRPVLALADEWASGPYAVPARWAAGRIRAALDPEATP